MLLNPKIRHLQGDGMTWEIHLGTKLRVKVVPPPNIFHSQCISAEWAVIFEKNAFEILRSPYVLLSCVPCQSDLA